MIISNIDLSSVNKVNAKVELYSGSTLVTTCTCNDRLQDFTVERMGQNNKFFGFGVFHKLTVHLIDLERNLTVTKEHSFKVHCGTEDTYVSPYPTFYAEEITRDEETNTIKVVAYDKLHAIEGTTVNELGLIAPYMLGDAVLHCTDYFRWESPLLGKNLWDNNGYPAHVSDGHLIEKTDTGFIFTRLNATGGREVFYSIGVRAGDTYTFSYDVVGRGQLYIYDSIVYGTALASTYNNSLTHTFEKNTIAVFTIIIESTVDSLVATNIQVEKSPARTTYEPYLSEFDTYYEVGEGANLDGTESCKEFLNAIAEVTQTIYYLNNQDRLVFKRLSRDGLPEVTITKNDYYTLVSGEKYKLGTITNTTELGDATSATIGEGYTQFVRDNPFWELRKDLPELLDKAIAGIGGIEASQFTCDWDGNFLLEPGDKIALITEDDQEIYSYVLDSVVSYGGYMGEVTQWTHEDRIETAENPTSLGDALKQTFARVDKANKEITLVASDVAANSEAIASLVIKTDGISAKVEEFVASDVGALTERVGALEVKADGITASVSEVVGDVSALREDVDAVDAQAAANGTKIEAHTQKLAELTVATDGITASVSRVETKVDVTAQDLSNLDDRVVDLDVIMEEHTERIGKLEIKDTEIVASVSSVETRTGKLEGYYQELDDIVHDDHVVVESHIEKIAALEVRDDEITASVSRVETKVDVTAQDLQTIDQVTATHTEKIAALEIKDSEITASVKTVDSKVNTTAKDLSDLDDRVVDLDVITAGHTNQIADNTTQIGANTTRIETNTEQISQLTIEDNRIATSVSTLEKTTTTRLDGINESYETLNQKVTTLEQTDSQLKLDITNIQNNGVSKVETTTGFTFDNNGLTIEKSDSEISTNIDEDGLSVFKSSEEVLTADNQGVKAQNLHATTYLIIGNNTYFADFIDEKTNEDRAGCFWTGK